MDLVKLIGLQIFIDVMPDFIAGGVRSTPGFFKHYRVQGIVISSR